MPLNQFVPVRPNSCACHSRCTGTKCSGCARHKVETHRETGTMWRDALQIAGWDAHVVQPALIAAGISNYGCHTPADAPWEKYGCTCMDGLNCTLLWCTGRLADTNFWLSMSLLNTLKNYGPVKHAPSLSMTSLQFSSKYLCYFIMLPCQNCDCVRPRQ